MTSEVLVVPEEYLQEVILVIRTGLKHIKPKKTISRTTRSQLAKWCKEEEAYLERF